MVIGLYSVAWGLFRDAIYAVLIDRLVIDYLDRVEISINRFFLGMVSINRKNGQASASRPCALFNKQSTNLLSDAYPVLLLDSFFVVDLNRSIFITANTTLSM